MIKRLVLVAALLTNIVANANEIFNPSTFNKLNEQEKLQNNKKDLKVNKFYLNINPKDIKRLQKKDERIKQTLDKFDGAILNYKPVIRPLSTNDEIMVHPYFSTTILLPNGAKISYPDISFTPATLKVQQNTVLLRVKKDFEIGNLTLIYNLNKVNYVLNIMLKRYDRKKTDEKLSLVYSYKNIKKQDDLEVISKYVKTYGRYPNRKINYIWIDGIVYRIIQDRKNGNVMVNHRKYLIDTGDVR